jgi:TolB-like protein
LPARIPVWLQQVVQRCLAKDRHARYADVDELRAALGTTPARRRTTAALLTMIGVLAMAAAGGVLLSRGWYAPSPHSVAIGAGGRPAIAVMSFENMTDAADLAWLSKVVPNMLLTGLGQTQGLDLVSEQRLHQEMERMGIRSLETMTRTQTAEIAKRVGAGAVVEGTFTRIGEEFRIDAHVEDLSTGKVLVAESVRGTDMFCIGRSTGGTDTRRPRLRRWHRHPKRC